MESSEKSGLIDQGRNHLRKTISHYLIKLDDGGLPRDPKGQLKILSVGCGFGYEAEPVTKIFHNSQYKGIDIRQEAIFVAQQINADVSSDAIQFSIEDATVVDDSEKDKYGLVIIRHPQVLGNIREVLRDPFSKENTVEVWKKIIESSIQKLSSGGYILATTDSNDERQRIIEFLEENKVKVLINKENTTFQNPLLTYRDSIVIVGYKGKNI